MSGLHRIIATVICSTLGSLVVMAIYSRVTGLPMFPTAWFATILCPIVISTPVAIVLVRQSERVRLLNQDLRHAVAELDRVASTDDLTGIANRRAFLRAAAEARGDENDWLLLADIDHFKSINDRFGHERGDAFLAAFARLLEEAAGPGDVVGRLGGEEFGMLLRDTTQANALQAAEALRVRAASLTLTSADGRVIATTLSIGLTACPSEATLHDDLKRADEALYLAKRKGRDQICVHDGSGEPIAQVVSILRRPA